MSTWLGKFKVPQLDTLQCDSPHAFEIKQLRAVGLIPEEWLCVRLPRGLPFIVLQKRSAPLVYLVLSRRVL